MSIGFDLDKIFINHPPFIPSSLIEFLYKEKNSNALKYRIPSRVEQYIRILAHHPLLRPAIWENIQFIEKFSKNKKDNKLYLITSRFGFLEKRTNNIIKTYKFNAIFDNIYCNQENEQPHIFKNKLIKKLNIEAFLDDDLPLLKFLALENPTVHFYWLNNKKTGFVNTNIAAITNLSQIKLQ